MILQAPKRQGHAENEIEIGQYQCTCAIYKELNQEHLSQTENLIDITFHCIFDLKIIHPVQVTHTCIIICVDVLFIVAASVVVECGCRTQIPSKGVRST